MNAPYQYVVTAGNFRTFFQRRETALNDFVKLDFVEMFVKIK